MVDKVRQPAAPTLIEPLDGPTMGLACWFIVDIVAGGDVR